MLWAHRNPLSCIIPMREEVVAGWLSIVRCTMESKVYDLERLRELVHVFRDRRHAGAVLATMLKDYRKTEAIVLAIPAGGVPVAAIVAAKLELPLDVAVVSKITFSWDSESGYGAIAFDGTVRLNEPLVRRFNLNQTEMERGVGSTQQKVERRVERFRQDRPFPDLSGRATILVDDGLASGFTMRVAVEAASRLGAKPVVVAVPTGHARSVTEVAARTDALHCANIRSGWSFAVADAYENWYDVSEEEAITLLKRHASSTP